jgi:hypothetical protein
MDQAVGKNNGIKLQNILLLFLNNNYYSFHLGTIKGRCYFNCSSERGLMLREEDVIRI